MANRFNHHRCELADVAPIFSVAQPSRARRVMLGARRVLRVLISPVASVRQAYAQWREALLRDAAARSLQAIENHKKRRG